MQPLLVCYAKDQQRGGGLSETSLTKSHFPIQKVTSFDNQ